MLCFVLAGCSDNAPSGPAKVPDHYVDIVGGAEHFRPDTIVIRDGETLAWRNVDTASHSVYGGVLGEINTGTIRPGFESRTLMLHAYSNPPSERAHGYICTVDTLRQNASFVIVQP